MSHSLYICGHDLASDSLASRVTRALERHFGAHGVCGGARPDPAALAAADLVIALIDRGWAGGARWLDDPADLTRAALMAAAQEGKVILPLLLGGAAMPQAEDLPDELRFLHFRNAQVVGAGATFDADVARIIETLEETRRGRAFGVQVGGAAISAGLWLVLIFNLQLLATFTPLGGVGAVAALFRSVRETSIIAFTPTALAALIFGARLLPQRRWLAAALLLVCAALMLEEMSRSAVIAGYAAPWSGVPWIVTLGPLTAGAHQELAAPWSSQLWIIALVTRPTLLALWVVVVATLGIISDRSRRTRYSHTMVMAQQRFREEAEAEQSGMTRDIFVSCRPEDMSATYRRLCAFVERYLTQNPRENRPLRQPAPVADGYATDDWQAALAASPDALVVIGPHWRAGLSDPADPIRRQLAEALRAGKALVPVLIDGARPPKLDDLPPELASLCFARPIVVGPTHRWYNYAGNDGYNNALFRLYGLPSSYSGLLVFVIDAWFFHYSPDVFLSYRRADSDAMCGRIYQALSRRSNLGKSVFRDTSAISAGVDFYAVLLGAIASSEIVLAVIGPQWLSLAGPSGARRLDDPEDMVRREIETALDDEKTVIPVLLDDTPLPTAAELPPTLAPLASLTPLRVRSGQGFRPDIARLSAVARRLLGIERHPALALLSALTAAVAGAALLINQRSDDFTIYLLHRNLWWCTPGLFPLCYTVPIDARIVSLTLLLLAVALGGSAAIYLAAFWLMMRRQQTARLGLFCFYLVWAALQIAWILAVFAGRLPAVLPLGTFGGSSYSSLTVPAVGWVLVAYSIVGALGLLWYFWQSQGAPRKS